MVSQVVLEAGTIFQITRHAHDIYPDTACGVLLGSELAPEITETFPLPPQAMDGNGAGIREKEVAAYEKLMVTSLKTVGADSVVKGYFLSCTKSGLFEAPLLDSLYHIQRANEVAVFVQHDVALSRASGSLELRAYQLSPAFMEVRSEGKHGAFNTETMLEAGLGYESFFVEIPVVIHNSHLVNFAALSLPAPPKQYLAVPTQSLLEAESSDIMDIIDDFNYDQNSFSHYQRQLAREKQKVVAWQQRRAAENRARDAVDKPLLPTDEWKTLFKLPEEPSRLENLLTSGRLQSSSERMEELLAQAGTTLLSTRSE